MIQNVLQNIGGIGLYGVISICLFFLVFTGALIRACLLKKPFLDSMSTLPLKDGDERPARGCSSRSTSASTKTDSIPEPLASHEGCGWDSRGPAGR